MFGDSIPVASRPEVGSTSFALVTFAANSGAREAPRVAETAVQCISVSGDLYAVNAVCACISIGRASLARENDAGGSWGQEVHILPVNI